MNLLDLLEATTLDECALSFKVGWENLSELGADIGEDVVGCKLEERLKSGEVGAHLDDVLKGLFGLVLKIFGALWEHVYCEES